MRWKILIVIALLVVVFFGLESFGRFTYAEMDWNGDGTTTIGEILDAMDYQGDTKVANGRRCRNIYALKDGAPVSRHCEKLDVELPTQSTAD